VVTVVANEVGGYTERKKRNDLYDEECQIKVEGRQEARIKMQITRTRMNSENYKNKRREDKKSVEQRQELEGMEEANKRNETLKFGTIFGALKADFQPRKSICTDRNNKRDVHYSVHRDTTMKITNKMHYID